MKALIIALALSFVTVSQDELMKSLLFWLQIQPLTLLVTALTIAVAIAIASEETCDECYLELHKCIAACREPGSYVIPPVCNGVECLENFDSCWYEHCIIEDVEGSGEIDGQWLDANTERGVNFRLEMNFALKLFHEIVNWKTFCSHSTQCRFRFRHS